MASFGTLAALVNRVSVMIELDRRLTLVVGSGLTAGAVPGVAAMLDLTEEFVAGENNDDLTAALATARSSSKTLADTYGDYRRIVNEWLPSPGFDLIVQAAVLRAYPKALNRQRWREIAAREAQELEGDVDNWIIPPGVNALAELLVSYPDAFGRRIFTPNFDPLLEIAINKLGSRAITLSLKTDGSFSSVIGDDAIHIIHLHGYWRSSDSDDTRPMLHDPHQLSKSRPTLQNELAEFLQPTAACAVGYGGWDDIFMRTLVHVAKVRRLEVMWGFKSSAADRLKSDSVPILRRFASANSLVTYGGIEGDVFFPSLLERAKSRQPSRVYPVAGDGDSSGVQNSATHEQALGSSPEESSEILRRLDRLLAWRWDQGPGGSSNDPRIVYWSVRLRRRSIIHAVQARVAASLSAHGAEVILCLDDLGVEGSREKSLEFVDYINRLFSDVRGSIEPEVISLEEHLSDIEVSRAASSAFASDRLPETPWKVLQHYLALSSPSIVDVLSVAKIIDFSIDAEREDQLEVLRHSLERRDGNKLLTPITLWAHVNHIVNNRGSNSLLTLSGSDETALWQMWRTVFNRPIGHLFNPKLNNLHQDSGLLRWENGSQLRQSLSKARDLPNWDQSGRFIPWLYANTVLLRSFLDEDHQLPEVAGQIWSTWQVARNVLATHKRQAIDALAGAIADFFEPGTGID